MEVLGRLECEFTPSKTMGNSELNYQKFVFHEYSPTY